MKIFAIGDLHGDTSLAKKAAEQAEKEKADLVLITGDITNFDDSTDNMIKPFVERHEKVLFIPGNHDSIVTKDFITEFYGIKNLHGYSVKYNEVGIFGCGGANCGPSLTVGDDEMFKLLKEGFDHIQYLKKKIMVTHVHPAETKMEKMSAFIKGSAGVKKAIDTFKPDILLCSHIHEAEGLEEKVGNTRVINVGRKGRVIEI